MGEGRAFGKAILIGEHAVVHGAPALAVALDHGARANATRLVRGPSLLRIAPWQLEATPGDGSPLGRAFAEVLGHALRAPSVRVEVATDLPPGGGLGCSAALGVAIVRALFPRAPLGVVLHRAMTWERVFHGNPSGVDAEVAARGGVVWFRRGEPVASIDVRTPFTLVVGKSGVPSSTKAMVERVAEVRRTEPARAERAFGEIARLAELARGSLEAGSLEMLGAAMTEAHAVLRTLGVSSPELELMCTLAHAEGALGSKLTGAGGGGSVVALAKDDAAAASILAAWRRAGFDGFASHPEPRLAEEKAS